MMYKNRARLLKGRRQKVVVLGDVHHIVEDPPQAVRGQTTTFCGEFFCLESRYGGKMISATKSKKFPIIPPKYFECLYRKSA